MNSPRARVLQFGAICGMLLLIVVGCNRDELAPRYDLVPLVEPGIAQGQLSEKPPIPDVIKDVLIDLDIDVDNAVPPPTPDRFEGSYRANNYTLSETFTGDLLEVGRRIDPYFLRLYRYNSFRPFDITVDYCQAGIGATGIQGNILGDPVNGDSIVVTFTTDNLDELDLFDADAGEVQISDFQLLQVVSGKLVELADGTRGIEAFQVVVTVITKEDVSNNVIPLDAPRVFIENDPIAEEYVDNWPRGCN